MHIRHERQAESLVKFLEKNNSIRVKQIVLDFIQDIEGKIWLISIKSIRVENTITMGQIMAKKASKFHPSRYSLPKNYFQDPDEEDSKKTLDQLTCSVYCKLCGILFKKDDASKVLTYKLLWELVQHLKKRNIPLKNIKVSHSSTRPCRVCNLCYMLVVGEHELIEIEQKFAEAQNIPIYDAVIRVPIDTKPKHRPALLNETLNQWRLIFYACDLNNIGIEQNIDFTNLYFQYKLHNYKTSFKITPKELETDKKTTAGDPFGIRSNLKSARNDLKSPINQSQQGFKHFSHLSMNHIRVHYIFSEDLNIEKFLKESQIKVRLTQGPDWNAFLAEGSSKTISHFKNKEMGGQRHSSQILLFFENAKYCVLKINAGLVCDGEYNTGKLNLHKYNDIYFPDESFYNSNPFPDEWMEMFDPQYVLTQSSQMSFTFYFGFLFSIFQQNNVKSRKEDMKEQEGTEKYSPKCTPAELNKMIDFNSHKSKSNVQSKVSQMIRAQSAATLMSGLGVGTAKMQLSPHEQQEQFAQTNFIPFSDKPKYSQPTEMETEFAKREKRAATAKYQMKKNATQSKLQRPVTSMPGYNQHDLASQKSPEGAEIRQAPQGSYAFILNNDDKKKRKQEIADQLKKYGLQSDDEKSGDEEEDFDNLPDEGEEIIREKLREHFKQINKMNDNQYDSQ